MRVLGRVGQHLSHRSVPAGGLEKLSIRIKAARAEQDAGINPLGLIFPSPKFKLCRSSNFNRNVLQRAYAMAGWRDAGLPLVAWTHRLK